MRHRSKTNSRPHEDLIFREEYRDANPFCEIARLFPEWDRGWTKIPGSPNDTIVRALDTPTTQIHHIGWGGQRWDTKWNLIALGGWSHDFCHKNKWDGLALCLKAKIDKGEWNAADAMIRLGYDLMGKLYYQPCKYEFAETIRKELMKGAWG